MGPVTSPSLHHRLDRVERVGREAALFELPSLLQPVRLEAGYALEMPVAAAGARVCSHGCDRVVGRRHPGTQAWTDGLRNGHAPRSADVEQGQDHHQLGTRLGRPVSDHSLSAVGTDAGLQFAVLLSPLPQSPRVDQRKEEDPEAGCQATPEFLPDNANNNKRATKETRRIGHVPNWPWKCCRKWKVGCQIGTSW